MDEITRHEPAAENVGTQTAASPEQAAQQQQQPESPAEGRPTNEQAMEALEVSDDSGVRSKLRIYTIFIALCVLQPPNPHLDALWAPSC